MSGDSHSKQPNCTDDTKANILPPEAHDLIEADQELIWEIDDYAAYKITYECRRDKCQKEYHSVKIIGQKLKTIRDCKTIAYQIYVSYYDNPRTIPYRVLQRLIDVPDPGTQNAVADDLANAAKLGCTDADANQAKRTKQELFDIVLPDLV